MEVTPEESNANNDTKNDDAEVKQVTASTTKKSASSSARARAEARRRRILESSAKRMNVVSGDVPASVPTTTDTSSPETKDDTKGDDINKDDNEKKEETTEADKDEIKEPSATKSEVSRSTSSSRLAQMRRRRFRKDQSIKKEDTATATASSEEKKSKDDDGVVISKEDGQATTTEAQNASTDVKTESVTEVETSEVKTGEDKKYLGVARMRRKRLAEKKKKEESEATLVDTSNTNVLHKSRARSSEKVNNLPIYFHLFITLILFSVGIQIGLKQHSHIIWEEGMVVNKLSLKESTVLSYLQYKDDESVLKSFTMDDHSPDIDVGEEDEFSTDELSTEYFNAESEKNIDPIFRVDLDELTRGPSFFNKIARIAVRCHRALIAMVLFFPQTLMSIPNAIVTTKCYPYFFFISAFLRQSSALFGATIPPKTEDEEDTNKKDLVTMMIAGAKEMIGKTVPGFSVLKFLYTLLQEGRDDMMVVLCGLMFGLVLPLMKTDSIDDGNHGELGAIGEEL